MFPPFQKDGNDTRVYDLAQTALKRLKEKKVIPDGQKVKDFTWAQYLNGIEKNSIENQEFASRLIFIEEWAFHNWYKDKGLYTSLSNKQRLLAYDFCILLKNNDTDLTTLKKMHQVYEAYTCLRCLNATVDRLLLKMTNDPAYILSYKDLRDVLVRFNLLRGKIVADGSKDANLPIMVIRTVINVDNYAEGNRKESFPELKAKTETNFEQLYPKLLAAENKNTYKTGTMNALTTKKQNIDKSKKQTKKEKEKKITKEEHIKKESDNEYDIFLRDWEAIYKYFTDAKYKATYDNSITESGTKIKKAAVVPRNPPTTVAKNAFLSSKTLTDSDIDGESPLPAASPPGAASPPAADADPPAADEDAASPPRRRRRRRRRRRYFYNIIK